jgi:hypothetical protein
MRQTRNLNSGHPVLFILPCFLTMMGREKKMGEGLRKPGIHTQELLLRVGA